VSKDYPALIAEVELAPGKPEQTKANKTEKKCPPPDILGLLNCWEIKHKKIILEISVP
jgi:hypothetical protein